MFETFSGLNPKIENIENIKLVAIDGDGTLTDPKWDSWPYLTKRLAEEMGWPGDNKKNVETHNQIYKRYEEESAKKIPGAYSRMKTALIELWTYGAENISKEKVEKIISEIEVRENAKETIKFLQQNGILTGLVTASFEPFASYLKKLLDLDFAFANTRFTYDSSGNFQDFIQDPDFAGLKFRQIQSLMKRKHFSPNEVLVIGDNFYDERLFDHFPGIVMLNRASSSSLKLAEHPNTIAVVENFGSIFEISKFLLRKRDSQG